MKYTLERIFKVRQSIIKSPQLQTRPQFLMLWLFGVFGLLQAGTKQGWVRSAECLVAWAGRRNWGRFSTPQ